MLSSQVLSKYIYFMQGSLKSIILILWKIKNLHTSLQHKRGVYMIFISKVFFFFSKMCGFTIYVDSLKENNSSFFSIEERNYLMISENQVKWINVVMSVAIFAKKTMFRASLPPVVCRRTHVLFAFDCAWWCPTHIVLYFCFDFLRLVYHLLPVSLGCLFLIATLVFSNV